MQIAEMGLCHACQRWLSTHVADDVHVCSVYRVYSGVQLYRENPDEYLAEDLDEEVVPDPKSPTAPVAVAKKERAAKVVKDQVKNYPS